MSDLSDAGFLEQPHTSAGRIPTAQAYRYYANQLTGEATLSPADESLIQDNLQGLNDVQEFMERTSHVLSLISHGVGVTVPPARDNVMRWNMCTSSAWATRKSLPWSSCAMGWCAIGCCACQTS